MIQAVIFDMGGTLLHFKRFGSGTWREFETPGLRMLYHYFVEQGYPMATNEDTFVEVMFSRLAEGWEQSTSGQVNLRATEWITRGAADHGLILDEMALIEAARRFARPVRESLRGAPGAAETLAALRVQGLRIGMISNTIWPGKLHLEDLDALGLLQHIEHTIFSGDLGIWKPRPKVFLHMLHALGVPANQALFVGDSPREDILGAQRVGMRAVWVANDEFPLGQVQPDAVIHELPELLPLILRYSL